MKCIVQLPNIIERIAECLAQLLQYDATQAAV
jgi:hypothetical protein